jgi:polysaccharide deacetylase 2 family uncharacterized protein YibQ
MSKLLTDFLESQKILLQMPIAPPKKCKKTNKNLINPAAPGEVEEGFEYIITKKPKAKKVVKYLQGMADAIMAEADN